ncbi:hypothetical protein HMPREF2956_06185 [Staphylococcus sp. HMSC055B03]|uniref:hypothetical protein n=1 Tax=Staphylococcus TaxID=1279 RepID=UPI00066AE6EB|nr:MULTISPECIES: hypothetical protein [Staphylococcus]OFS33366.1 hypothetical protein HMPREF2956_06185 [Staphylococcus sp. HMSC055B03]
MSSKKKHINNNRNNYKNNFGKNINNNNMKSNNNQNNKGNIVSQKYDNSSHDKVENNHTNNQKEISKNNTSANVTQLVRFLLIQHNFNELKQAFENSPTILGTKEMKRFQPIVIDLIRNLKSALDLNNKEITSKLGLSQTSIKRFTHLEFIDERIKISTLNTIIKNVDTILTEHQNILEDFDDDFMFTIDNLYKLK